MPVVLHAAKHKLHMLLIRPCEFVRVLVYIRLAGVTPRTAQCALLEQTTWPQRQENVGGVAAFVVASVEPSLEFLQLGRVLRFV